ncbi:MAG: DUF3037 domain-containing protein [Solibacillus sp.]|uniref:DUF3037 domain-containing protein n=1 Tax=Solibacillus sp. TaxID=1909654 RepID=UPI003315CE91
MEGTKYWYSIISYVPKNLLNERLNVGLILHSPSSKAVKWFLLDEKNRKLNSILTSSVLVEEYKIRKMLFEQKLKQSSSEELTLTDYDFSNDKLFEELANDFTPYLKFSTKQLVMSENIELIFNKLAEIYISKNFLEKRIGTHTVKQVVKKVFEKENLIGTKIKTDVSITPIKEIVSLNYKVDFIYKNSLFHLVQAVPRNHDNLNDWFSKMMLFQNEFKNNHKIEILYDEEFIENFKEAKEILMYLNKDNSTNIIDLKSHQFKSYCNNIKSNGLLINDFEKELNIV